jgi:hypothetical protein
MNVPIVGGCIVVGLALLNEPNTAIKLVTSAITIRGGAWLCTKITTIDKNASDIINFTGWSLAGIPIVGILKLATRGLPELLQRWAEIEGKIESVGTWINNLF